MLQDSFRKHRRWWLAGLLVLVIPSFVLFLGGFGGVAPTQDPGVQIGHVGEVPIRAGELQAMVQQELQRRAQSGQDVTAEDLAADGTLLRIRESLIQQKLIEHYINEMGLSFEREYLADQLKEMPELRTPEGRFDHEKWNAWVQDSRINWNALYASAQEDARRLVFSKRLLAGARILESELREQFEEQNTQIDVKYLTIEPPVEVTEEEIQAEYEANLDRYENPAERVARFVTFSLSPEKPAMADDLVEQARGGADFAELATEHSEGPEAGQGGDLGWIPITETMPPHRAVLKDMAVGDVSDAVQFGRGWYIFKIEEERTTDDGTREVKVRQILLTAELDEAQRQAIMDEAQAFVDAAHEAQDFAAAADAAGLEVAVSSPFSTQSVEVENVAPADVTGFRAGFANLEAGDISEPVVATQNVYVGEVIEVLPTTTKPLEEVRDRVVGVIETMKKREPAYQEELRKLAEEIQAQVDSLEAIPQQFPLVADAQIQDMPPFTPGEFDYSAGVFWNPQDIYTAVKDAQPGDLIGPITDFLGKVYFLELEALTPPTEADWETKWPEEREQLRDQALQLAENQRAQDYIKFLEEQAYGTVDIQLDDATMLQAVGILQEDPTAPPATEGLPELGVDPADMTTEEAPAAEGTAAPEVTVEDMPAETEAEPAAETPAEGAAPTEAPAGGETATQEVTVE